MDQPTRIDPPRRGDEKETLIGLLNFLRQTIVLKCNGLTEEQMRCASTVSSITLLGLVKHLIIVERYWFQGVFLDAQIDAPWSDEDPVADWRYNEDDTSASAIAAYNAECEISDRIVRDHSLDELAIWATSDDHRVSLRYILTHMIEETARHCGHADIIREAIDGVTGD